MSAEIVRFRPRSPRQEIDFTAPRPLVVHAADALRILRMAREELKAAKGVDHRRRDVREIDTLLWLVDDTLSRGIAEP